MNIRAIVAVAGLAVSPMTFADQSAVQFEVVLSRGGSVVASPKAVAEFGKTVAIQTADLKFEGSASVPDKNGNSLTAVRLQLVENGATRQLKEMSMLARRYDAPTLEKWGLINLTVPEESLETATMAIAEEFAQGPTVAHAATKELAHIAVNQGVVAADEAMARVQAPIWASEDLKTGLASFRKNGPGLAKFAGR